MDSSPLKDMAQALLFRPSLATSLRNHLSYTETGVWIDANVGFIHLGVSKTLVRVEFPKPRFRR